MWVQSARSGVALLEADVQAIEKEMHELRQLLASTLARE